VQGKINTGRHTDHLAGCHFIRTNQCPPSPFPIFYRPDAFPATHPTVSKHWRQLVQDAEVLLNGVTCTISVPLVQQYNKGLLPFGQCHITARHKNRSHWPVRVQTFGTDMAGSWGISNNELSPQNFENRTAFGELSSFLAHSCEWSVFLALLCTLWIDAGQWCLRTLLALPM